MSQSAACVCRYSPTKAAEDTLYDERELVIRSEAGDASIYEYV